MVRSIKDLPSIALQGGRQLPAKICEAVNNNTVRSLVCLQMRNLLRPFTQTVERRRQFCCGPGGGGCCAHVRDPTMPTSPHLRRRPLAPPDKLPWQEP